MNKLKRIAMVAALVGLTAGCTDPATAERALKGNNLKNINIEGYRFFGCGEGDMYHTGFVALNQDNEPVSGVVCSGLLKGATVRFD